MRRWAKVLRWIRRFGFAADEIQKNPEQAIDTISLGMDEAVQQILLKPEHEGYLR